MATDPYNLATDDIRKRMQQLQERGLIREAQPEPLEAPAARPTAGQRPRAQFMDQTPASTSLASDRQRAGLTRVVRQTDANGNSVYTDAPSAQGEERYYGALGNRADANFDPRTGRDVAVDLSTAAGQRQTFDNAQQQRRGLGRMLADNQARAQGTDPSNPQGLAWVQTENGPRVMSAAERSAGAGGSFGDRLSLLRLQRDIERDRVTDARNATADARSAAQLDISERSLERQNRNDLLAAVREDPAALIQTRLSSLFGRDLTNPTDAAAADEFFNSDEGRLVLNQLTQQFRQRNREGNMSFGLGMTSNPTFADLRPSRAPGQSGRYVVEGDELFGAQLSPEDLGLSPEMLELLTTYSARQRARSQR